MVHSATPNTALALWQRRLIDTSRRNNLLYFKDLRAGTLDLGAAPPEAIQRLVAGETVPLVALAPGQTAEQIGARALAIRRRAGVNHDEKGIDTLHVALGLATWSVTDGGNPPGAAVLLLPVVIDLRGRDGRRATVRAAGEVVVNRALLHVLAEEHGLRLAPADLLPEPDPDQEGEPPPLNPAEVYERFRQKAGDLPGFAIAPRAVLGNFSFQKLAMLEDMQANAEALGRHPIIAAISGDSAARAQTLAQRKPVDPTGFDALSPDDEFLVLDADSSQQRVTAAVAGGQSGVIQGPPGTGKSQTIVNLIASLAARGQRVLFVAEKRAALEVVQNRLERLGLGHLALDLHGADLTRKQLMARVNAALGNVRQSPPVDAAVTHQRFSAARSTLADHAWRANQPRSPSGLSAYEMQGRLLQSSLAARTELRWRGADLDRLTGPAAERIRAALRDAAPQADLLTRTHPSGWTRAALEDGRLAEQAVDAATRLFRTRLPDLRAAMDQLSQAAGLRGSVTLDDAERTLAILMRVERVFTNFFAAVFGLNLGTLVKSLEPGAALAKHLWSSLTSRPYREARKTLLATRRSKEVSASDLLLEAQQADLALRDWRTHAEADRAPSVPAALAAAQDAFTHAKGDLAIMGMALGAETVRTWAAEPLDALIERLARLTAESAIAFVIPRVRELERTLTVSGAGAYLDELRRVRPPAAEWEARFDFAWLASCHDRVLAEDTRMAAFNATAHDGTVAEFRRLDRERIALAAGRVRRAHAERAVAAMNTFPDQASLVRREAEKKSRHKPLRRLFAEAPDVLTALFPCLMASPLSVSQLLAGDRAYFDVVIFDEASQVLPEDAVCAILRGKHVVVAGDKHQLPPTRFFVGGETGDEADDEDEAANGFESLLDQMSAFLDPWMLEWHYRSRDERLIAFSNRHIYQNRLVTFPSPRNGQAVGHVLVTPAPEAPPAEPGSEDVRTFDSSTLEARQVVELILEHARARPDESLGVIALGITHARRIQDALDAALAGHPEFDAFFDETRAEKFFIKNLERVQGDERDAIILSVGYTKDRAGRLPYRFGPLLFEGGERRLNVAVTRARNRLALVSSFTHQDMDPERSRARGVQLLRAYLEYAAGGAPSSAGTAAGVTHNPLESDVAGALTAQGLGVVVDLGQAADRIDLAVRHPDDETAYVLALESDGPEYVNAPTVRDRDRLRAQQFESLGWRYRRVWGAAWFAHRDAQTKTILGAYADAVAANPKVTTTPAADAPPATEPSPIEPPPSAAAPAVAPGTRPPIRPGLGIGAYSRAEMVGLARWIMSDGALRTDAELVDALIVELGFTRRGAKIVKALAEAAAVARAADSIRGARTP